MNLPVFLFTDFGAADIYVGQVKAELHARAPGCAVIDLLNDAPAFDIQASAHLLAALVGYLPPECVVLGVIDPGVGSARGAVALEADGRWLIGPDNGLFSVVSQRAATSACFALDWLPSPGSASFHGRDLFAPAAAAIASARVDVRSRAQRTGLQVELDPADLPRIVYVDHYGNAMAGIRASTVDRNARLRLKGRVLRYARVFSEVPRGEIFWYENSIGLVEIAANQANASSLLALAVGDAVAVERA